MTRLSEVLYVTFGKYLLSYFVSICLFYMQLLIMK